MNVAAFSPWADPAGRVATSVTGRLLRIPAMDVQCARHALTTSDLQLKVKRALVAHLARLDVGKPPAPGSLDETFHLYLNGTITVAEAGARVGDKALRALTLKLEREDAEGRRVAGKETGSIHSRTCPTTFAGASVASICAWPREKDTKPLRAFVGPRLRARREACGLRQHDLATQLRRSTGTIGHVENGLVWTTPEVLLPWLAALGWTVVDLLGVPPLQLHLTIAEVATHQPASGAALVALLAAMEAPCSG